MSAGSGVSQVSIEAIAERNKGFMRLFKKKNVNQIAMWGIMLPGLIYIVIFHYIPMLGLVVAFKDYNSYQGILGSPWAGMKGIAHFYNFLTMPDFWKLVWNTLKLSLTSLLFATIPPAAFALLLNEISGKRFKKIVQTVSYAPYFISMVVVVSMLFIFTNAETGIINRLLEMIGMKAIPFMERADMFVGLYVASGVWQGLGWAAIIYVGTLANVDQSLHEAASLDGASRFQRVIHINLPTIVPIMLIMLIMNVGNLLNVGFEKVYLMQTAGNLSSSRIISTYVYEVSLKSSIPQYSYATAIGIFNSAVNIVLLVITNMICKKKGDISLW